MTSCIFTNAPLRQPCLQTVGSSKLCIHSCILKSMNGCTVCTFFSVLTTHPPPFFHSKTKISFHPLFHPPLSTNPLPHPPSLSHFHLSSTMFVPLRSYLCLFTMHCVSSLTNSFLHQQTTTRHHHQSNTTTYHHNLLPLPSTTTYHHKRKHHPPIHHHTSPTNLSADGRVLKVFNRGREDRIESTIIESMLIFPEGYAVKELKIYESPLKGYRHKRLLVLSEQQLRSVALHRCRAAATCL